MLTQVGIKGESFVCILSGNRQNGKDRQNQQFVSTWKVINAHRCIDGDADNRMFWMYWSLQCDWSSLQYVENYSGSH